MLFLFLKYVYMCMENALEGIKVVHNIWKTELGSGLRAQPQGQEDLHPPLAAV